MFSNLWLFFEGVDGRGFPWGAVPVRAPTYPHGRRYVVMGSPLPTRNLTDPANMTPQQRSTELAALFAAGFVRLSTHAVRPGTAYLNGFRAQGHASGRPGRQDTAQAHAKLRAAPFV